MADLIAGLVLITGALGLSVWCFLYPDGVYRRSALWSVLTIGGVLALLMLAQPLFGSGAGLGLAFLFYGFTALVIVLAVLACLGATARHVWNRLGGGHQAGQGPG